MVARTSSLLSSDPKTDASVPIGSSRLKGFPHTGAAENLDSEPALVQAMRLAQETEGRKTWTLPPAR